MRRLTDQMSGGLLGGGAAADDGPDPRPTRTEVAERWGDKIYAIAYRLTGDPHDAADLAQDVYVRIHHKLDRYHPGTFDGWVYRVTKNLFLDRVRRQSRSRTEPLGEDNWAEPVSRDPEPPDVVERRTLDHRVQAGLDHLPPNFRMAVVLSDIENLTYDEIARVTGWPIGTVRSRIHRGRARMRAWLEATHTAAGAKDHGAAAGGQRRRRADVRAGRRCWTHEVEDVVRHLAHDS